MHASLTGSSWFHIGRLLVSESSGVLLFPPRHTLLCSLKRPTTTASHFEHRPRGRVDLAAGSSLPLSTTTSSLSRFDSGRFPVVLPNNALAPCALLDHFFPPHSFYRTLNQALRIHLVAIKLTRKRCSRWQPCRAGVPVSLT